MLNRREFIVATASTVALSGGAGLGISHSSRRRRQPGDGLEVDELGEGVWALLGRGGNVLVIRTEDAPVIVDAKNADAAPLLWARVKELTGAEPGTLINTHHHADHTGGNYLFSGQATAHAHKNRPPRLDGYMQRFQQGAFKAVESLRIGRVRGIGHEQAGELAERASNLAVDDFKPDKTFSDATTLEIGGVTIELHHFGPGHTDNDAVVHLPDRNVLHAGDLLFHELYPFIDRPGGADTQGWQHALNECIKLCGEADTTVVPGHGRVTHKGGLRDQIEFFNTLRRIVKEAMRADLTREEITALKPAAFADLGFEQIRPRCLGAMYEELAAEGEAS